MAQNPGSVLVVDDDAGLRTLSRIVLELEGFHVREAASLAEAEAAIAEERPDVVLLDVHLGPHHSADLFRRLQEDGIPVAAVSGTSEPAEYESIADASLGKPYQPSALVAVVKRLMGRVQE
jgi:DNA-binding response OmpR family regulator